MTATESGPREALAQRVRELLAGYRNVREVRMFGGLSFMVEDRMTLSAGRHGDLLVRTNPAEYDELLRRRGTPAYMGKDRPMGPGWISVPQDQIRGPAALAYWVKVEIDARSAPG